MPYFGVSAKTFGFEATAKDTFSGDDSTVAFTLSQTSATNDVEVFVGNVQQEPTIAYSISGSTLTFTEAPPTGTNNIYVLHRGRTRDTILPPADLGDKNYAMSGALSVTGNVTTTGNLKINDGGNIGSTSTTDAITVSTGGGITFKNDIQNPRIKVDGSASGTGLFSLVAPNSSTNRTVNLPDKAGSIALGAGAIIQVVSETLTSASTISATSGGSTFTDVSGLSASITPASTDNKILVIADTKINGLDGNNTCTVRVLRGSTAFYQGDAGSSRPRTSSSGLAVGGDSGVVKVRSQSRFGGYLG